MKEFIWKKKVSVERSGKHSEMYTLYMDIGEGLYTATRDKDETPKIMYIINLGTDIVKSPPFVYTQDGHKLGGEYNGS